MPTRVTGNVCHGLPIESVQLNGKEIFDPADQHCVEIPDVTNGVSLCTLPDQRNAWARPTSPGT